MGMRKFLEKSLFSTWQTRERVTELNHVIAYNRAVLLIVAIWSVLTVAGRMGKRYTTGIHKSDFFNTT